MGVFHSLGSLCLHVTGLHMRPPTDRSGRPVRGLLEEGLERLSGFAIQSGAHMNWIDFSIDSQLESLRPGVLDTSIYAGRGGLALLFERAYRVLGDPLWLETARAAIGGELKKLESPEFARQMSSWPVNGLLGRAGLVAGAWAVGRHEDHGRCREFARDLAVSVSDRVVRKDDSFDLIAGSAGYLLLLLRLNEEEPLPGIESLVDRLSRHLVDHAVEFDGVGWNSPTGTIPLCGLGHGRSGIALALLEAGRFLGRADLRDKALEAFEAEHRLRGESGGDGWPDYRGLEADQKAQAGFSMHRWCAGSEGIALARAAALQVAALPVAEDAGGDRPAGLAALRGAVLGLRSRPAQPRLSRVEAMAIASRCGINSSGLSHSHTTQTHTLRPEGPHATPPPARGGAM